MDCWISTSASKAASIARKLLARCVLVIFCLHDDIHVGRAVIVARQQSLLDRRSSEWAMPLDACDLLGGTMGSFLHHRPSWLCCSDARSSGCMTATRAAGGSCLFFVAPSLLGKLSDRLDNPDRGRSSSASLGVRA